MNALITNSSGNTITTDNIISANSGKIKFILNNNELKIFLDSGSGYIEILSQSELNPELIGDCEISISQLMSDSL